MHTYKYEMRDAGGNISTGMVQADSLSQASAAVSGQGGYLLNIAPANGMQKAQNLLEGLRNIRVESGPSLKDVLNFTNQLAVMIKAGINVRTAIAGIAEQVSNAKFKEILMEIKDNVESGQPFSEALARHPKIFSPLYVNMVRASEMSGNFAHMLERIVSYLTQQIETRSMIRGAMVYPTIIAVTAIGTTIFLLTFVLPKFTTMFEGKEHLLPGPTTFLMNLSYFLRTYWYAIIVFIGCVTTGMVFWVRTPTGRDCWDRFKLKIPLFKSMLRALYITRGLNTMGEMINAGVPMLDTLKITADVSGHSQYKKMWDDVCVSVQQGNKISSQLGHYELLPSNVVQMISAGEESGKLGEVMRDIADFYAKELKATIKAVTSMIEPLMIVIMGVVVGFIAMSIILPIFKMSSLVKS